MHLAVDAHGMSVRVFITQGTTADCTQIDRLIKELDADYLLADRDYDNNAIIEQARREGMEIVISSKKNRTA
ncbi:Transposase DDE domain-containing protein [Nitrosomonas cryotolerans]|nr:Transposase DDE domain-containing protein [Nitrosomonas cryotolerans]